MAGDPTPLYYVAGTVGSIIAALLGANTYWKRQRKQWVDEGAERARNAEALDSNTKAAQDNTKAISVLGQKLDAFSTEMREELRQHRSRLERLEDWRTRNQNRQHQP